MNEAVIKMMPDSLRLSVQQHDLGETIRLFTGEPGAHTAVGEVYNFDDFPCLEEEEAEDVEEIALATAEKIVKAYNSHDGLLEACEQLLLLIRHETNLPQSARNGVTDSTGTVDEGEVKAAEILENARAAIAKARKAAQ